MTSQKRILANRLNAKKSTGPRTSWGKSRASGNAWRHGWAVANTVPSPVSGEVERMAKAICGEDASPALYEQAVIMAECEMVLLKLRAARVAIIRGDSIVGRKLEKPNQESCFWANELMLAMEALAGGELRPAINLVKGQTRVLRDAITRVTKAKGKIGAKEADRGDAEESFPTPATNLDTSVRASDEGRDSGEARDEVYELQRALPELVTLERYERRAMSRRKRAMRMFEAISIVTPFLSREIKGS